MTPRCLALALVLMAIPAGWAGAQAPGQAPVDAREVAAKAREHFTHGRELYAVGDARGTLAEFERAYALRPSALLSFQIGQVALELRQFARSYRAFGEFLGTATATDPATQAKRNEAEAMLKQLSPLVAHLSLETNVEGARLSLDGRAVGDAPLADLVLDTGTVRVLATKAGFVPVARTVALGAGDRVSLRVELEPLEPESLEPEPLAPAPQPSVPVVSAAPERPAVASNTEPRTAGSGSKLMTPTLWASFAASGVLAIVGGATGIYALRESGELKRTRFMGESAERDFTQESERVRALSIAADVLLAGALVTAHVSIFVLVWRTRHPGKSPAAQPSFKLSAHASALSLQGTF